MKTRHALAATAVGVALVVAGCTTPPSPPPTPPQTPLTTPGGPASTSPAPTPSPEPMAPLTSITLNPPSPEFGPTWSQVLTIPYGDAPEQLGTSLGGDGEGIRWGPSYGTQLPDGTWWFVDTGKLRLAHYSEHGDFLGDLRLPEEHLAQGQYLQYARPLALSDGTLVLQSTTPDSPGMLLLAPDGTLSRTPSDQWWSVHMTDGTYLYGFDDAGAAIRVDPRTGSAIPVAALSTVSGQELRIHREPGALEIELGGRVRNLPVAATGHDDAEVHLGIEAAVGSDGVANVLLSGMVEETAGEITDVHGLLRIDADGRGAVDDLPTLTSEADPADGLRLGVRWGDDRPWLMLIGDDAVRVYRKAVS